MEREITIG